MSRENVEAVRAAWAAWERGDMEALFDLYDPAVVWDQTHTQHGTLDLAGEYQGHDGVKQFFRAWLAPFASYYAHAEDFIDAGDAVVVRARQGGTGKGSGAEVEMPTYWQVYRLRDGKVIRVEPYDTETEALEAVGLRE